MTQHTGSADKARTRAFVLGQYLAKNGPIERLTSPTSDPSNKPEVQTTRWLETWQASWDRLGEKA